MAKLSYATLWAGRRGLVEENSTRKDVL